jgi:hypothetical protein
MPENIAQAITEFVPYLDDMIVHRTAVGAVVAAIFDQCNLCFPRTERVVAGVIDGARKSGGRGFVRHLQSPF